MVIKDIHDLIKLGIHVNGVTFLPGIGTLRIHRSPASYTTDRKTILPPSSTLIFEEKESRENNIINLAIACGINASMADNWLMALQHSLNNDASSIVLRNIGIFEKNEGRYIFQPDSHTNWNGYRDWPIVNIHPLITTNKNYEFAVAQPKALNHPWKKKETNWKTWIFPISAISFVALFLLLRSCSHQGSENMLNHSSKDTLINKESSVDSTVGHTALLDRVSELKVDSNQNNNIKSLDSITSGANVEALHAADSTCVFIVGSFHRYENAKKLKNRLRRKGYSVEILENRSFYRVGFSIPCTPRMQLPAEILQKYPDVWLLEP